MSLLSRITSNAEGVTVKTFVNSELSQLLIALALIAVYIIEINNHLSNDQFIAGALTTLLGYYFGGKASQSAAQTSSTSTIDAVTKTQSNNTNS